MPNNTHKAAAVAFVNSKGERSMKRVKVERYVAGKKPSYAAEDDDDDEYTTDDGEEYEEEGSDENEEEFGVRQTSDELRPDSPSRRRDGDVSSDDNCDAKPSVILPQKSESSAAAPQAKEEANNHDEDDDDDDDDPRFSRLRQIEASSKHTRDNEVASTTTHYQIRSKIETDFGKNVVLDEDDDEEEIRQRHAAAIKRELEDPLGAKAVLGNLEERGDEANLESDEEDGRQTRRLDTDDLLKDLKLTGIGFRSRDERVKSLLDEEEQVKKLQLESMLQQAKEEALLMSQTYKKVDEDIRQEIEREALAKGDIGAFEMSSVRTDDEDDELAQEEWKLREMKRLARNRTERLAAAERRTATAR